MSGSSNVLFAKDQIDYLSKKVNLTKENVEYILACYVNYLKRKIMNGESVKFLNICCFMNRDNKSLSGYETLAYTASEITNQYWLKVGSNIIYRVLKEFENYILLELKKGNGFSIRYLMRLRVDGDDEKHVVCRKSAIYTGMNVYVWGTWYFNRLLNTD